MKVLLPGVESKPPTWLALLSTELLVAREVYAAELSGELTYFNRLSETLMEKGLASRSTVSKALEVLFEQGIVKAEWKRRDTGKFVRALTITEGAREFVASIHTHTSTRGG